MKILRASVMTPSEWFKERNQSQWKKIREQILFRDEYTCVYCGLCCKKFMQVNHIGAEDDSRLKNLETVCTACHNVLHLGINASNGLLTVFDCKRDVKNMAAIVCVTRALVAKGVSWSEIEKQIMLRFARLGGKHYGIEDSVSFANDMLCSIKRGNYRGYLPEGYAVMFHSAGSWMGYHEKVWRWQCLPGSRYRKEDWEKLNKGI